MKSACVHPRATWRSEKLVRAHGPFVRRIQIALPISPLCKLRRNVESLKRRFEFMRTRSTPLGSQGHLAKMQRKTNFWKPTCRRNMRTTWRSLCAHCHQYLSCPPLAGWVYNIVRWIGIGRARPTSASSTPMCLATSCVRPGFGLHLRGAARAYRGHSGRRCKALKPDVLPFVRAPRCGIHSPPHLGFRKVQSRARNV